MKPEIDIAAKVCSVLGILGALAVLTSILYSHKSLRNPISGVAFALSVTDLMNGILELAGRYNWGDPDPDDPQCAVEATLTEFETFASVYLYVAMACMSLYIVKFNGSVEILRKCMGWIIALCFVLPIPSSILILVLKPDGSHLYGRDDDECWIPSKHLWYQMNLWLIPLWSCFIVCLVLYTIIFIELVRTMSIRRRPRSDDICGWMLTRMLTYTICFFIIWLPPTLSRLVRTSHHHVFAFVVLQNTLSPARGLIDYIAYILTEPVLQKPKSQSRIPLKPPVQSPV